MFDDVLQGIVDWATGLSAADVRRYVLLAAAVALAYLVVRGIVRRLLPLLLRGGVIPVGRAVVWTAGVACLSLQALCALPFRALGKRPPALVYVAGDGLADVTHNLRNRLASLAWRTYALGRVRPLVLVALLAGGLWWGHAVSCDRSPGSQWCRRPADWVVQTAGDGLDRLTGTIGFTFPGATAPPAGTPPS
jgi:hypothetical protein